MKWQISNCKQLSSLVSKILKLFIASSLTYSQFYSFGSSNRLKLQISIGWWHRIISDIGYIMKKNQKSEIFSFTQTWHGEGEGARVNLWFSISDDPYDIQLADSVIHAGWGWEWERERVDFWFLLISPCIGPRNVKTSTVSFASISRFLISNDKVRVLVLNSEISNQEYIINWLQFEICHVLGLIHSRIYIRWIFREAEHRGTPLLRCAFADT